MKLKDALDAKKFVVTSEIQPPVDETPEDIVKKLDRVRGRVDGVAVSELDLEGVVTDTVNTCALLKENDFIFLLKLIIGAIIAILSLSISSVTRQTVGLNPSS